MVGRKKKNIQGARLSKLSLPPVKKNMDKYKWQIIYNRFNPTLPAIPEERDLNLGLKKTLKPVMNEDGDGSNTKVNTRRSKISVTPNSTDTFNVPILREDLQQVGPSRNQRKKRSASRIPEEPKAKSSRFSQ